MIRDISALLSSDGQSKGRVPQAPGHICSLPGEPAEVVWDLPPRGGTGPLAPGGRRSGEAVTSPPLSVRDEFDMEQFASCSPMIKKERWQSSVLVDSHAAATEDLIPAWERAPRRRWELIPGHLLKWLESVLGM